MPQDAESFDVETEGGKLVKVPNLEKEMLNQSTSDFVKHFKPLFEEMDAWRKESASSQTQVA